MKSRILYPLLTILLTFFSYSICAKSTILVYGDSLSAGYKISPDTQWVQLLENRLTNTYPNYTVVNASVSGLTAANATQNLPTLIDEYKPSIVIIALGSNDGLRGMPLLAIKLNINKLVTTAKQNAKVLLVGFRLPPNYSEPYTSQFADIFPTIAKENDVPFVPFLLEGIAHNLNYFQTDQLHPTSAAQPIILDNVWPYLEPMLN